ncbi:UDP-galactopyranose mutase [Mucilaginibacter sp.]|uniref:UDP-galactopyranose mutase n=1 Tax=Mucilaginibacter sp. TaxID=1882438 RepID=UPI003D0BA7CA
MNLNSLDLTDYFSSINESVTQVKTSEDVVVKAVGRELYEIFFKDYTKRQWDLNPSELDASARVPARNNKDDRYFTDTYQAMPLHGYIKMFERMLSHPNFKIILNTDNHEIVDKIYFRKMIFTGPVDEYLDFCLVNYHIAPFILNLRHLIKIFIIPGQSIILTIMTLPE